MEHIYPTFERGRIMKKELLWALRDYSYTALRRNDKVPELPLSFAKGRTGSVCTG